MKNKLSLIKSFYNKQKRLPSFEELKELFSIKSKGHVSVIVDDLVDKGFISKEDGKLSLGPHFFDIPILGSIIAGVPMMEDELSRGFVSLSSSYEPEHTYALVVKGDSMIGAGIIEGDIVVLNNNLEPRVGDIIAAFIDHEWTLKYYRKNHKGVYLQSANTNYKDIYPKNQLTTGGVVQEVIRKYIH